MPKDIVYTINKDINFKKWDDAIQSSINPYIYANSWYLDLVSEDWDALIYGDYEIVFPLPFNIKYGIYYIHQPLMTQQLGFFSKSLVSKEICDEFIKLIPKKFKLIELNLNKYNSLNEKLIFEKKVNIELNLFEDSEKIKSKYSNNHKRNIKKAIKNNLSISPHTKVEELIELFKNNKGAEIDVFSDTNYKRISRLFYQLIYKGKGRLISVVNEKNILLASAFFAYDYNRLIFLFSGQNNEGREKGAMHFLINNIIEQFSGQQLILDFEGSNNEGIKKFYLGFGSESFTYNSIKIENTNFIENIGLKIYKNLKK